MRGAFQKEGRQCPFYPQTVLFLNEDCGTEGMFLPFPLALLPGQMYAGWPKEHPTQGWWVWWAGRCHPVRASRAPPKWRCLVLFPGAVSLHPSLRSGCFPACLYPLHPRPPHRGDSGGLHRLGSVRRPGEGRADLCLACVWSRKPRKKSTAGREGNNFGQGCGLVLAQVPRLGWGATSLAVICSMDSTRHLKNVPMGGRFSDLCSQWCKPSAKGRRAGRLEGPPR